MIIWRDRENNMASSTYSSRFMRHDERTVGRLTPVRSGARSKSRAEIVLESGRLSGICWYILVATALFCLFALGNQ